MKTESIYNVKSKKLNQLSKEEIEAHTYIYTHIHMCIYIYMHTCIYIYVCIRTHAHGYAHVASSSGLGFDSVCGFQIDGYAD